MNGLGASFDPAHVKTTLVRLNFVPNGDLSPTLLADRISAFVDVSDPEMQTVQQH
jgi:hypothetical protein